MKQNSAKQRRKEGDKTKEMREGESRKDGVLSRRKGLSEECEKNGSNG